jgi:acetolactate synthase-1/2/3 large subunit
MPYMRWSGMMKLIDRPDAPPHLIRIDIDPSEMQRLKPHYPIVADSAAGAQALLDAVRTMRAQRSRGDIRNPDHAPIAAARAEAARAIAKVQPQMDYLSIIRETLPRDGLLVEELSQVGFASYFGYPVFAPRTYISCGYQGTLGFGFQTALGVKAAHPDRPVVSITGDGGFMFGVQELATAAQYGIGLITLLFNNNAFGNVMRDQNVGFGGRVIGAALENPDFMMLAQAFGVEAHHVDSPAALRPVLAQALTANRPVLIEIAITQGAEASPWEFIHPAR